MANSVLSAPRFHNEEIAFEYVEAQLWPNGPVCPHCGEREKIGRLQGKSSRPGLRKCYGCRKPFTVRIGSIFEDSHLPLHLWLQAIHLLSASKKGISTRQLQRMLGCGMKTAWHLGHRIRAAMDDKPGMFYSPLGGAGKTVEADETFVGGKAENRAYRAPGAKQIVLALVERSGAVRSFHIPDVTAKTLGTLVGKHAHPDSRFMTDEWSSYTAMGWNFHSHKTVNHSAKEYVKHGYIHTNTVEGYFSILKRGIFGIYQHVSSAHLHRYLCEFDFRYSYRVRLGYDDEQRADLIVQGARGKRLTYETARSARPS
ncbi:MAG: IS1595 family transposase [Xanthobacteraceae bacterium]